MGVDAFHGNRSTPTATWPVNSCSCVPHGFGLTRGENKLTLPLFDQAMESERLTQDQEWYIEADVIGIVRKHLLAHQCANTQCLNSLGPLHRGKMYGYIFMYNPFNPGFEYR